VVKHKKREKSMLHSHFAQCSSFSHWLCTKTEHF